MRKMMIVGVLVALQGGFAQAGDGKVDFGFFDTPVNQAKKFESAFRQNDRITGINIDGRSFSLGGEWTVINAWGAIGELKGDSKVVSDGLLLLGRVNGKKLEDTLYIAVRLQPPVQNEYKSKLDRVCLTEKNTIISEVSRAEEAYQSCMKIILDPYEDKGDSAGRVERAVKNYASANGLSIQPNGTKMFSVDVYESRRSAQVYIDRYVVSEGSNLEELKQFAQDLRQSIKQSFFKN